MFNIPPTEPVPPRLSSGEAEILEVMLSGANAATGVANLDYQELDSLRNMYEPYVNALSQYLLMPLPDWLPSSDLTDDWRTSSWEHA